MKKLLIIFLGAMIFYACAEPECELRGDDFSGVELKSKMGLTKSEATPFPTWARMGAGVPTGIPANDDYGVICFYVDPYDIPEFEYVNVPPTFTGDEPHNLLNWYDPRALWLPIEFTVEGTAWNQPGNPAPHHMHLDGKGAVPIWILTRQQVTDVTFDGIVTIAELDALPDPWPLKGTASIFNEVVRVFGGGAPINGLQLVAKGELEDGRRFDFNYHTKSLPGEPIEYRVILNIFK